MNELLGFAVLTGPLWLLVILIPVSILIAFIIAKRFESRRTRIAVGLLAFLLVFSVPFGDEIAGRIYLSHLCATEAGVKVYQTVELPEEYWDKDGNARFLKPNGDLNKALFRDRFSNPAMKSPYSAIFGIDIYRQKVVDSNVHETLGEVINFMYWGGKISRNLSSGRSAVDCKKLHGNKFWTDFYLSLFKQKNSVNK